MTPQGQVPADHDDVVARFNHVLQFHRTGRESQFVLEIRPGLGRVMNLSHCCFHKLPFNLV